MGEAPEVPERRGLLRSIWHSIFRGPVVPRDERERRRVVLIHLPLHLRPTRVPEAALRYSRTFGLGGMALVLIGLLMVTGVLLVFVYKPSPEDAHGSLLTLQREVLFGRLVRNVHYWSANLLVVVTCLHLLRVFFTGAFHGARQFNWVIGLLLLLGVLLSNFTGYLLPWDQRSYWAITICASMASYVPIAGPWLQRLVQGGSEIGASTLLNFYAIHTTISPVFILILVGFHSWRIRKAGGVVTPPVVGTPDRVSFVPNLLMREVAVGLGVVAGVLLLSVFASAPLGAPANPGMSPNPAKAPWYFMGFQELLLHFHSLFSVFVLPLAAAVALFLIPYLRYDAEPSGVWFLSAKGRRLAIGAAVFGLVVAPVLVIADEFIFTRESWLPGTASWLRSGVLPVAVLTFATCALAFALKRRFAPTRGEMTQTIFVLLVTAFAVLTMTGVWFRGRGMALTWPWSQPASAVTEIAEAEE